VTGTAGLTLLVYGLVQAAETGWGATDTLAAFAGAALSLALFAVIEWRASRPLVPVAVLNSRLRLGSLLGALTIGAALYSMLFFLTVYMQMGLGFDPLEAGLAYVPMTIVIMATAAFASTLVRRFGAPLVLVVGLALGAGGVAWMSGVSLGGSYTGDVLFPSILVGAAIGLSFVAMTVGITTGVSEKGTGLVSGVMQTGLKGGIALGLAVLTTRLASPELRDVHGEFDAATVAALVDGIGDALVLGAAIAGGGALMIAAMLLRSGASHEPVQVPSPAGR
jgi:hypothetical protein